MEWDDLTCLVGIFEIMENNTDIEDLLTGMCNAIKHKEWYKIQTLYGINEIKYAG